MSRGQSPKKFRVPKGKKGRKIMTKFNANMTELTERITIAIKESRVKKLTGEKQTQYIIARVWQLGEIGYTEYKAKREKQAAAAAAMREALEPSKPSKASKPKASKPKAEPKAE